MSDLVKTLRAACESQDKFNVLATINTLGQAADTIEQIQQRAGELEEENKALAAHVDRLEEVLSEKVIDLVRCGIGGNYGGSRYEDALVKFYEPLLQVRNQSPQTSLAEVRAKQAEESFIAGVKCVTDTDESVYEAAEEHANKIRNGKDSE